MVTIPSAANVNRVSPRTVQAPGLRISGKDAGAGQGRALQQAGQALNQIGQNFQRAEQAQRLNGATASATAALKELEFGFEEDPDYQTYEQRYNETAEEILQQQKEALGDGALFRAFQADFTKTRQAIGFNVRRMAREKQVDAGLAQLVRNLANYADLYASATNPAEQELIRSQALVDLADAAETGLITEEDRAKRELDFENDAEAVFVRRLIQQNPEVAEEALTDPERFRGLNEATRVALERQASTRAETVRRERVRVAEKAERDAERAMKAGQEQEFGRLYDRVLEGAVTDRDLDEALTDRRIDGDQFVRLRIAMDSEARPEDDPNVVLALYEDLDAGLLTKDRVLTAYANGHITRERASELRGAIDRGTSEVEKSALSFLRDNVGGVRGPLAVLDSQSSIREAAAIREFRDRVSRDEDPWDVADDVVARYRPTEPSLSALPKPRFLVGDVRDNADLQRTMEETVRRLQAGEIDQQTFEREAELLLQMERLNREREQRRQDRPATRR